MESSQVTSAVAASALRRGYGPTSIVLDNAVNRALRPGSLPKVGPDVVRDRVRRSDWSSAAMFTRALSSPDDLAEAAKDHRVRVLHEVAGNPATPREVAQRIVDTALDDGKYGLVVDASAGLDPHDLWELLHDDTHGKGCRAAVAEVAADPRRDSPALAAVARAAATKWADRWLLGVDDVVGFHTALALARMVGDGTAALPPVSPLDFAAYRWDDADRRGGDTLEDLIVDTDDPRLSGDTVAARVRCLRESLQQDMQGQAPAYRDTGTRAGLAQKAVHRTIGRLAVNGRPPCDEVAAELAETLDVVVACLQQDQGARRPPSAGRVQMPVSARRSQRDRTGALSAQWIAAVLARGQHVDVGVHEAQGLRDVLDVGVVDGRALADCAGPVARAVAATVEGDRVRRAEALRELLDDDTPQGQPMTQVLMSLRGPLDIGPEDAVDLARATTGPTVRVACMLTSEYGHADPALLRALHYASTMPAQRVWRTAGLKNTAVEEAFAAAAAAADVEDLWLLVRQEGDRAGYWGHGTTEAQAHSTMLVHGLQKAADAALRRGDLPQPLRDALVAQFFTDAARPWRTDLNGAGTSALEGQVLRGEELARVCRARQDFADAVAHISTAMTAGPEVEAVVQHVIDLLPVKGWAQPYSPMANAIGRAVNDRFGDDPEAWRAVFALLPQWDGTVGELLDGVAAVCDQ